MDGGAGGDDVGYGERVEAEYHDEYRAHGGEENFLPKTVKGRLVVVSRNMATKEYRARHDECEKDEDFRNRTAVSTTLCDLVVVRKLDRDEECEVECENDIDERVAPLRHSVEKEHSKDREEKRKFFEEGENCRGIHKSIIVRNAGFVLANCIQNPLTKVNLKINLCV